jgi:hypothetical protein
VYRHQRWLIACVVGAFVLLPTACLPDDGTAGLPDTTTPAAPSSTTAVVTSPATTSSASTSIQPISPVPIGDVPGNPDAVTALAPWTADLLSADITVLEQKCWTIAPKNIDEMYADKDAIVAALAAPGVDGQFAVSWTGPVATVSVKRSEIASGYACPRVYPTGSGAAFNDADARHAVRRYLSRFVGKPVNAADVEDKYRLVCAGSTLANNPGRLTGTTGFDDAEITTEASGEGSATVTAPVTNSSGITATREFTLGVGPEGYCIEDISP